MTYAWIWCFDDKGVIRIFPAVSKLPTHAVRFYRADRACSLRAWMLRTVPLGLSEGRAGFMDELIG